LDLIGCLNDREILYQRHDLEIDWVKNLPESNWLFLAIIEIDNSWIIDEIARRIIDKNVCYACCVGTYAEKMHDLIDENLVIREVEIENLHLPKHAVMTTWHKNIEDGLWFASFCAFHETESIDKILCMDITSSSCKEVISELNDRFNKGYIPE
jgi:hypothetical protein